MHSDQTYYSQSVRPSMRHKLHPSLVCVRMQVLRLCACYSASKSLSALLHALYREISLRNLCVHSCNTNKMMHLSVRKARICGLHVYTRTTVGIKHFNVRETYLCLCMYTRQHTLLLFLSYLALRTTFFLLCVCVWMMLLILIFHVRGVCVHLCVYVN